MVNAVGLAGPGVAAWRAQYLPDLLDRHATVVGSIWGRTIEEFADAANAMRGAKVVALEVNASCPNLESRREIFAHSPERHGRDRGGRKVVRSAAVGETESQYATLARGRGRRN